MGTTLSRLRSRPAVSTAWNRLLFHGLPLLGKCRRRLQSAPEHSRKDPTTLRILADSDDRPLSGTFLALNDLLNVLADDGADVTLLYPYVDELGPTRYKLVKTPRRLSQQLEYYDNADFVFTQQWRAKRVNRLARSAGTHVAYIWHGPTTIPTEQMKWPPDLLISVGAFMLPSNPFNCQTFWLHQPIDITRLQASPGDLITTINVSEMKGGRLFFELARRRPNLSFLAVQGWGDQVACPPDVQNVTIQPMTADMESVYSRTRVLLNPSDNEGYGRVGLEAAALGIPTIANPCSGLVESLGAAALWADRDNLDSWLEAIDSLEDPADYQTAAARAQAHYAKMQMTAADDVQHLMELMQRETS